ncbi:unnamed protein product, partial [Ilex paraguariensis]
MADLVHRHVVDLEEEEFCTVLVMFEKDIKPVHVTYYVGNVKGEGLIMVMPSLEDGLGQTVMVTLPEEQMAELLL